MGVFSSKESEQPKPRAGRDLHFEPAVLHYSNPSSRNSTVVSQSRLERELEFEAALWRYRITSSRVAPQPLSSNRRFELETQENYTYSSIGSTPSNPYLTSSNNPALTIPTYTSVPTRQIESPEACKKNSQLFNLGDSPFYNSISVVSYIPVSFCDSDYITILSMITNKRNFKVDSIEKIINPFLQKAYELKKEQKEDDFPNYEERLLFHGTKQTHVSQICESNFNWRLCQAHKYGKGISFSPNSTYASVYSDRNVHDKVMLVAKVLIGRSCIGNSYMEYPPEGYDTTQKDDGVVIVKFDDNEFYPAYKINYHLVDETVGLASRNRNRRRRF